MELHTIGIDLGKTVFHLVGLNRHGDVVVRKKFSRIQLLRFTANVHVELMGMEACGGAHFLGRALGEQGHEVRLIPAQYVKPYVKTNKSDYIDAEAIAEAVARPTMRFVGHPFILCRLHGSYPESALCKVKDGVLDVWSATWKVSSGCRLCSQASGRLRLPIASIIARRILRLRPSSGLQIVNPATRGLDRSAWHARRVRNTLPGKRWSSPRMRTRRPSDRADSPCTRGFQAIALMRVTLRRPATRRLRSMPGHATLPAAIDWMRPHQAPCAAPTRGYSATPHTTSRHTVR